MACAKCGNKSHQGEQFCRKCGAALISANEAPLSASVKQDVVRKNSPVDAKDPDELTGNGIGKLFVGDGFLMVAVFLGVTHSSVSSLLWLLLLIPAFFFYGKGLADFFHANQIRRRAKQAALDGTPQFAELRPPRASVVDVFRSQSTSELSATPSVTERTTRQLK